LPTTAEQSLAGRLAPRRGERRQGRVKVDAAVVKEATSTARVTVDAVNDG
jgi:hypothetical protein